MRFPFARYLSLVAVGLAGVLLAVHAQTAATPAVPTTQKAPKAAPTWEKEMAEFTTADKKAPPPASPIVFTGSSSIRRWDGLVDDFSGLRVMNRGFGGSQLSDIRTHFDSLILRYKPRQVVIYSGGNDLNAGKTVERVVDDLKAIVDRIHKDLPRTRVLYISTALNPSRWAQREKVVAANKAIADYLARDPRDAYVDIIPPMLGANGEPKPEIFVADGLHMNRSGYQLWIPLIKPKLLAP